MWVCLAGGEAGAGVGAGLFFFNEYFFFLNCNLFLYTAGSY